MTDTAPVVEPPAAPAPIVAPPDTGTAEPTAPPAAPPAPEAPAADPMVDPFDLGQSDFKRPYVEALRNEAAARRVALREAEAQLSRYNDSWNTQDIYTIHALHHPEIVFDNHTAAERAEGADAVREHRPPSPRPRPTTRTARSRAPRSSSSCSPSSPSSSRPRSASR